MVDHDHGTSQENQLERYFQWTQLGGGDLGNGGSVQVMDMPLSWWPDTSTSNDLQCYHGILRPNCVSQGRSRTVKYTKGVPFG